MNLSLRIWRLTAEFFTRFDSTLRLVILLIGSLCIILTVIVGFMALFNELPPWKLYVSIGFTSTLAVIYYLSYIDEYLSQRFFVLFVILAGCCIKLMAKAPVDDYGYLFIYCAPLLSMVFLTPRDTKLIISVNTVVFILLLILSMQINNAGLSALNNGLFITHFALFVVLNYALPLSFRDLTSIDRMASKALIKENLQLRTNYENFLRMFNESNKAKAIVNLEKSKLETVNESMKCLLGHAWQSRLLTALDRQRNAIEKFEPATVTIGSKTYNIESDRAYSPDLRTLTFSETVDLKNVHPDDAKQRSSTLNLPPMLDRNGLIERLLMISETNIATLKIERTNHSSERSVESVDSRTLHQFIQRLHSSFPTSPLARLSRHVFVVVFNEKNPAEIQSYCRQLVHETFNRSKSMQNRIHVCISHASGSVDLLHHTLDKSLELVHKSQNHYAYSFILNESQLAPVLQQRKEQVTSLFENKKFKTVYRPLSNGMNTMIGVEAKTRLDVPDHEDHLNQELLRIAKRANQLPTMTLYGLEQLCRTLSNLDHCKGLSDDFLSTIDLSASELRSEAFINQFLMTINRYTIPTQTIAIAISERAFLEHWEQIRMNIRILRSFGIRLALTDVSSHKRILSTLLDAPVDCILLNSSFVTACLQNPEEVGPLHLLDKLCTELNIRVVARGIECNHGKADPLHRFSSIQRQCRDFEVGLSRTQTIELFQKSVQV